MLCNMKDKDLFSLSQLSTNTVGKCVGQRVFSTVKTTIEPPVSLEFSQGKIGNLRNVFSTSETDGEYQIFEDLSFCTISGR